MNECKLAGCVVLYHPDEGIIDRIMEYVEELNALYLIDNSERVSETLCARLRALPRCFYISLHGNKGIAKALNVGLKRAHAGHAEWLLTLDQDSEIKAFHVQQMKEYICNECPGRVAVVGGNCQDPFNPPARSAQKATYVNKIITSGSIVRISAALQIGGWLNKLFIDEVDHEFCYRALSNGYSVVRLNDVIFQHHFGNATKNRGIVCYHYPPVRYYYIVRNRMYVFRMYRHLPAVKERSMALDKWVRRIWHEEDRARKYLYMLLGFLDYWLGRFGKCRWKF